MKNSNHSTTFTRSTPRTPFPWIPLLFFALVLVLAISLTINLWVGLRWREELKIRQSTGQEYYYPSPIAKSLSTNKIVVGEKLTILGENFGENEGRVVLKALTSENKVISGQAKIISWKDSEIIIEVPKVLETDINYTLSVDAAGSPYSEGVAKELGTPVYWEVNSNREVFILPDAYEYTVKPGDSLMKIANEKLGAEGRYLEIIKLNKPLYPDLDKTTVIGVGMKLRLPKD